MRAFSRAEQSTSITHHRHAFTGLSQDNGSTGASTSLLNDDELESAPLNALTLRTSAFHGSLILLTFVILLL